MCHACKTSECGTGQTLLVPGQENRQRFICVKCIAATKDATVRHALETNALSASQVLALRVGRGCPRDCLTARAGVCSVATRAHALQELADSL
jgi:hypothetical protein